MGGSEDVVKGAEKGGDVIKTVVVVIGKSSIGCVSFCCFLVDFCVNAVCVSVFVFASNAGGSSFVCGSAPACRPTIHHVGDTTCCTTPKSCCFFQDSCS